MAFLTELAKRGSKDVDSPFIDVMDTIEACRDAINTIAYFVENNSTLDVTKKVILDFVIDIDTFLAEAVYVAEGVVYNHSDSVANFQSTLFALPERIGKNIPGHHS
ncbi:MAG: hypothetical protein Q9204_002507 [Flavoplaca sp. TL-2023a]